MHHFKRLTLLLAILVFITNCKPTQTADQTTIPDLPKLVIFISIDQMRFDYFERFNEHFKGGLKRIWEEGMVFTDAHHFHAFTATGPGHATLSTGCFPSHHGIVENDFFNQKTGQIDYSVTDASAKIIGVENDGNLTGVSPRNMLKTGLGDWLKKANSNKSDTWCSKLIAKMDIAQGRDAETIRKNMKK